MAKKNAMGKIKDMDDMLKLLTGKRIKDVVPRAIELFGEELVQRLLKDIPTRPTLDDPYSVLEIRSGASDFIVQAAYRAMARKYHPDNLDTGNEEKFKHVTEAYEKIQRIKKGG